MKQKIYKNPEIAVWEALTARPALSLQTLTAVVEQVFTAVGEKGDDALKEYTLQFDKVALEHLQVSQAEVEEAKELISEELKAAIHLAYQNIQTFHQAQQTTIEKIETQPGVTCWRENRAIEKVGLYIPGGSAPLFSTVLMLGIPASIAGCKEVILCSPPNVQGKIHPAILYAADLVGVNAIYKLGGVQAIAAMTVGTETVPQVYKLFGPGNAYVMAAKQYAQQLGVAIDMPAGPSEVLVIADENADASFVAADLLSQAEHGPDSQVVLLSDSEEMLKAVIEEIEKQTALLPRQEMVAGALANSRFIFFDTLETCFQFSNAYAPEHLIVAVQNPETYISQIQNAGSVFLGKYSCESAGDYASGTNHTLPTSGYAKSYSGVSLDSFVKKITFQSLTEQGLQNIGPAIEQMAEAEELLAHKNAVTLRLNKLNRAK